MSGGSFNYLYAENALRALNGPYFPEALSALLEYDHPGARAAAQRMEQMLSLKRQAEHKWAELEDVLRALELWRSGDTSEERFIEACGRFPGGGGSRDD